MNVEYGFKIFDLKNIIKRIFIVFPNHNLFINIKVKLIFLLLITVNITFGGKCPPKEVISPCNCNGVSI